MVAATTECEPELRGQTVVAIGGSAGIGLETARRARAEGANVILTGRTSLSTYHPFAYRDFSTVDYERHSPRGVAR